VKTIKYKKIIIPIIIILSIFLIMIYSKSNTEDNKRNISNTNKIIDISKDNFTYSFLKLENKNENLVYSPLSIKYALSMLSEGANGNTKEEIDKLIKELTLTKYNNIDKVLSLANSVFIRDTYKEYVKEDYINSLKDKYNAEV